MALTQGYGPARRGAPPTSAGIFGGLVAAGEQIWRGGLIAWNAAGALQRLQTAGSVSFAGLAARDYNNTASAVAAASPPMEALKGVYALTVPNATFAEIGQPVFATDDNTLTLSNAMTAVFARNAGDTGTGSAAPTATAVAKVGQYIGAILAGATTFSLVDPTGAALPNGTLGSAYSQNGLSFTLSNSGTSFIAGDGWTITVEQSAGAMEVGTLAGIEAGQTYVKLLGS